MKNITSFGARGTNWGVGKADVIESVLRITKNAEVLRNIIAAKLDVCLFNV